MNQSDTSYNQTKFLPGSKNIQRSPINGMDEYQEIYKHSVNNPEAFWEQAANQIDWIKKWDTVSACNYDSAEIRWFVGGKLNVSFNCLDRHLKLNPDKLAIIAEGNEPGQVRNLTYLELHKEVCRFANGLKSIGVVKGDRVAIYLPMIPEAAIAMLACARIGAIHSVIFAGFSAEAIKGRVSDAECKVVITANEYKRGNKTFALKETVDSALTDISCVQNIIILQHTSSPLNLSSDKEIPWSDLVNGKADWCEPEIMDSEDPLFILYTSGSTGKPKGVVHTQGGYIVYTAYTHKQVFNCLDDDIYFCAADVGWITGHSYVVYGPLANGVTTVMFESVPNYPDSGRYWDICQRLGVTVFYTAPTAIRSVAKDGPNLPDNYDLSKLRTLGSVGEPINEDAWLWYYNKVGKGNCSIVDTWWQTETGGIMISPLSGVTPTKPGSATFPVFGISPVIVDENGKIKEENDVTGHLCIKQSWPGQMQTVYKDQKRFFDTYFSQYPGMYFTGDACYRDKEGYYWITGRVDDVLNVSGHRLGTAEIESALVHSGVIAEAAVVGVPHDIKGTAVYAFCILKTEYKDSNEALNLAKQSVRTMIGAFAAPDYIQFVSGLPRTRSGKIMRRILRKISCGETETIGDISTLAEPNVVKEIIDGFKDVR